VLIRIDSRQSSMEWGCGQCEFAVTCCQSPDTRRCIRVSTSRGYTPHPNSCHRFRNLVRCEAAGSIAMREIYARHGRMIGAIQYVAEMRALPTAPSRRRSIDDVIGETTDQVRRDVISNCIAACSMEVRL
jgi:hypothetical protein